MNGSDHVRVRERWAEYIEQLYQVDPLEFSLDARDVTIPLSDPSISEDPPILNEVRTAISKLKGKILSHILLKRFRNHLLRHQRLEQSRFTPGKSTIDRTLALRVNVERREFGRGLLAADIDLKKAPDSVHRESLREILRLRGILTWIIGLIAILYTAALEAFSNDTKPLGLQVSLTKSKIQDFEGLLREPAQSIRDCSYLGSAVHVSGLSDQEVSRRIDLAAGDMNSVNKRIWRCRYLSRTKLRVFKALILPILLYVSETWTVSSALESRLDPTPDHGLGSSTQVMHYQRLVERVLESYHLTNPSTDFLV
ncbi:uncharacterized protein [Penaeus vannamei]|uniref:uncharacterized protein n=1 Tax=Penaeus vannamei TaxID=6689 RepID=UPI00387F760F